MLHLIRLFASGALSVASIACGVLAFKLEQWADWVMGDDSWLPYD